MWQFKIFIFIAIVKESFCNGNLNRVYFTKREDDNDIFCKIDKHSSKNVTLDNFTETELKDKCKGYQFAEIPDCNKTICCNELGPNSLFYSLSTNIDEGPLCDSWTGPDSLYGATIELETNTNLFDLQSNWHTHNYLNEDYKYVGCVLNNAISSASDRTGIVAIKVQGSLNSVYYVDVNRSSEIRIWDFAGDCHSTIYSSAESVPYPVGKSSHGNGSTGK